jgi:hypothetical protein
MQRPDLAQRPQVRHASPAEEMLDRPHVGAARVGVADRRGEELQEALAGVVAGVGDDGWYSEAWTRIRTGDEIGSLYGRFLFHLPPEIVQAPYPRFGILSPYIKDIMYDEIGRKTAFESNGNLEVIARSNFAD